jgi:hypothetical protein
VIFLHKLLKKICLSFLVFVVLLITIPTITLAAGIQDCPLPYTYDANSLTLIQQNNIPTSITTGKGKKELNGNFLSNRCGMGSNLVVYGSPLQISISEGNLFDEGQWRYLGWDINGNFYRNWLFRSDSRATLHVYKNWVKTPWNTTVGENKKITPTPMLTSHPDARKWLEAIVDPYKESPTFIQSYNKRTGEGWNGDTLKDYVIIQQIPTDFSPGIIQMWNIWQPDGSWWYEMFYIPPLNKLEIKKQPDLIITDIKTDPAAAAAASWVGDSVTVNITSKNEGQESTGPFTVGIVGTNIKSEVISNIPPGQIKTVSVKVSSTTAGIVNYTAKTDFGEAVAESNENNNTKPFQIVFSKKNEPTTPIAIISHLEGDHRTKPEITIKPAAEPQLDDKLSYSPGKEAITLQEWKYKTPAGTTIQKKPTAKDFTNEGQYLIELRVTNSAKKVSDWAQLKINAATNATPDPSASPTPTPEPTPTPRPELMANIAFVPPSIIAGEASSLINRSKGLNGYSWKFSDNLKAALPNTTDYEFNDVKYFSAGNYIAEITVTDEFGGSQKATATLQVIDPKPVAIVSGISRVIQGRPLERPYNLLNSYTPLEDRGEKIDFSKSETRYKKIGSTAYINHWFTTTPSELGEYTIEGKVYDTTGRVSEWDAMIMEVVPDAPPTVTVVAPAESYRENGFMLFIDAESPDGDILKHLHVEERYDQDNDGNFEEEAWTTLYNGAYKTTHALTYNKVGKRQYRATVTEDYGMKGQSEIASTDILNYAPSVNFNVFGITQQPGQGENDGPPVTTYTPESIFRSWTLKKPYVGGAGDKLGWKADISNISTKNTVFASFAVGYPNLGNGANSRTKFQLASDIVGKPVWKLSVGTLIPQVFAGNRVYSYYVNDSKAGQPYVFSELDSLDGTVKRTFEVNSNNQKIAFKNIGPDETFYFYDRSDYAADIHQVKIIATDHKGNLKDQYSFRRSADSQDALGAGLNFLEISPDGEFMYMGYREAYNVIDTWTQYDVEQRFYKYSLKGKYLVWEAPGERKYAGYYSEIQMTLATDGSTYFTYHYQDRNAYRLSSYDGYLTKINSAGLKKSYRIGGSAGLSAAVVSDDNTRVYVHSVSVDYDGKRANPSLYTFVTNNEVLNGYSTYPLANVDAFGSHSWIDVAMYPNPLIFENTNVYVHNRIAAYNYLFDKHSNLVTRYNYNLPPANTSKMFITAAGDIVYPTLLQIGLTSWSDGNAPKDIRASLYSVNHAANLAQTPQTVFNAGAWTSGVAQSTPILPDGSIYIFFEQFVMPFTSASGSAAGSLKAVDADTVEIINDDWGGLLYDAGSSMKNYALEFNVSVNDINNDKIIGAGFQIQNEKNMYSMEWSKNALSLYRVVNGAKTLLQSAPMNRMAFNTYPIKVESVNGLQRIYVNYAKVLEVADGTYTKGYAGLISLGQPNAVFSNVKKTNYGDSYTQETYDAVLVNDPISYEKLFHDIEKDPVGAEEWSYSHNPNFFENPEGYSIHNGKTYSSTINALGKPGVYEIIFRAQDHPGLTGYRKWSEPVKKLIYVHRRPLAQPDVRFTGLVYAEGEALDYETNDKSYDPDIAHLLSDKLFRTRWADESVWTAGKRQYYNRPGVELIVQEQVRDIHGAWSYWGQTIVYKAALPPVNQTKPVMTITVPAGTTAAAPTTYVKEPIVRWTYYDAQNDPQERYRLTLTYVDTNETILSIEHEGNALTYPILEGTIQQGRVVKVQGQVYSKGIWSDLSNSRYFVLNLPPQTYLLSFNGADADHPIYTNSNRPQLRVFTVDPENHPIIAIDYEVFRSSNGAKVVDTETSTAATSYTPTALAEGLHYWKARANDSYMWGPYSSNGFFFVDTVKPADVNEVLEVEPTAVTVKFNAFSDAAPSSGHATRQFYLQKVNANGSISNIDLNGDGTTEYSIPLPLHQRTYKVSGLIPGQEYRVTVLDYDVAGNEGHYEYIYFSTNRPPTADFDWTPKPVYEGDMTTFNSQATDPDGDTLSVVYELTSPLGTKNTYAYTLNGPAYPAKGPSLRLATAGLWSMKMTVSDGMADPVTVTKSVQVLPLKLSGYVKHTELWDQHRKAYNLKASGHEDTPRGYAVFWAGEKFVLEAETTLTGTDTKAERLEVQMGAFRTSLAASNGAQNKWSGELWDLSFAKLAKGPVEFIFTAYYNNGTIVTTKVNVTIDGQTIEIVGVHRVQ